MSIKAIAVDPQNPAGFIEISPEMPVPGQYDLLVAVKAASVNPVDTKVHAGLQKSGLQQPRILGWDASGVVVEVGSGVSGFKPGDEVWYAGDITRPGSNSSHQLIDSRIAAHKPRSLNWAESAALPLTALTAWEALFEHLNIQDAPEHKTLLIIGGAGGVGSWCRERGADLVVDYRDLKGNLAQHGIEQVDYILCLNDTDGHWPAMAELVAPLGHICTIVENAQPLDQNALKLKSAALHWEFMFTRSMFTTPDIAQQGKILLQMAQLLDEGKLSTTLSETLHGLSVETLTAAHRQLLGGHMQGKLVIAY